MLVKLPHVPGQSCNLCLDPSNCPPPGQAGPTGQPIRFSEICATTNGPDEPPACQPEMATAPSYNCLLGFKVYIRDIHRSDGSGGFSDEEIENLLKYYV